MPIPQYVKASVALPRAEQYSGAIDPQQLPRLRAELAGPSPDLQVALGLEQDRIGDWLRGVVSGNLDLQCQRCQLFFAWPLNARLALRLVRSEAEAQQVLQDADPYEIVDDALPLVDIVEDEVLLALPMTPRCKACEAALAQTPEPAPADEGRPPNPFAALLQKR